MITDSTLRQRCQRVLGTCTCGRAWTDRSLIDKTCIWCNYGDEVMELLQEEWTNWNQDGYAERQCAAGIREAKHEVERIYAGCSDYDQGLEKIQEWCESRIKELEQAK